jgi:FkbM family methyltransferase
MFSYETALFYWSHWRWVRDRGDEKARLDYDLNDQSVVFDVGGYEGAWSQAIHSRFKSRIYIFEPIARFYKHISDQFKNFSNIDVYCYGLSNQNEKTSISINNDASSLFADGVVHETVCIRDIAEVVQELNVNQIDLMKINIEGAEYPLLDRLIETGDIEKIRDIQVQFHLFVPHARRHYAAIAKNLKKTHTLTWRYPFVWENWSLNSTSSSKKTER